VTAEAIIQSLARFVIASEAKQSIEPQGSLDCFVASLLAMTTLRGNARRLEQRL
jgi:hypothetical protein